MTTADILLFIDSDVVMHADVPSRVRQTFEETPGCVAVFGSYDDDPAVRTAASLYKNLLHHFTHQRGQREAVTFWAGCGAVDRRAFLDAGGFDATRYPRPSIEDIELGGRLRHRGGRIVLDKDMQAKHLKRWSLRQLWTTDIRQRAIPWSRLMLQPGYAVNDLNVTTGEKLKVPLAAVLVAVCLATPVYPPLFGAAALLLAAAWFANRDFFRLVLRRGGLRVAAVAVVLHQIYYLYGGAVYAYCFIERRSGLGPPA